MEARVQRLLRDARATVNRPTRPETPRELLTRQGSRRLSSVLLPSRSENFDNSGASMAASPNAMSPMHSTSGCSGSYGFGGSVASFAAALAAATSAKGCREDVMAKLAEMSTELRVVRPSDEDAAVELLSTTTRMCERAMEAGDAELSVRAASTACRVAVAGGSPAYTPSLATAVAVLASQAARGLGPVLKQEMVLDTLVQLLRMPTTLAPPSQSRATSSSSSTMTRDLLLNAITALRYCSSEGGPLLVHVATLGLLPAATQLTERVLPTRDLAILQHCAVIFRNFSVEYGHHFAKLKCLNTVLSLMHVSVGEGWKDIVTALSRALGKLVFDSDCVAVLQAWELPTPLLREGDCGGASTSAARRTAASVVLSALAGFATSKMIVARLSTVLERLLDLLPGASSQTGHSTLEDFCQCHQRELQQCAEGVSALIRKERKSTPSGEPGSTTENGGGAPRATAEAAGNAALFEEATTSVWRLFSTISLCSSGGRLLCTYATRALISWLQDRELLGADRENGEESAQGTAHDDGTILALMCLTNLSYYFPTTLVDEKGVSDIVQQLGPVVAGIVFSGNTELTVEGTRLLGNLSGTVSGRSWIEDNRIDEVCLVLLGHRDFRIVYNCFGVVLNLTATDSSHLMSQPELCAQLLQHTARYHLLNVSEDDSDEAQVSMLVEKILLNLAALM